MDYKNAKIYKILNDIDGDVYIGSTCQPLSKRMSKHRQSYKAKRKQHYKLYQKMNDVGIEHFYIELVKETPCENIEQLRAIEGQYIRELGTLNHRVEGRTKKQYTDDNKEKKAEYDKLRREEKGEEIKEQKRQHWEKVKDEKNEERRTKYQETKHNKIHCDVCNIDFVKESQYKHYKSIRHLKNLNNINEQKHLQTL